MFKKQGEKTLGNQKYDSRNIFKSKEYLKNKLEEISIKNRKVENKKNKKIQGLT